MLKYIFGIIVVVGVLFMLNDKMMAQGSNPGFMMISQENAKKIMDAEQDYQIVDVRNQDEYEQGHIPGATLVPLPSIRELAAKELPQKDRQLLVYCRSGRRSKQAAGILVELGYTNVKEFGGIIDWPYEVVK